jgi:hypothetical protein
MAWDYHALRLEIDTAVEKYAAALARERVTVKVGPVTAVLRLDGVLDGLVVDPRAWQRLDTLGEGARGGRRAAARAAAGRRDALAGRVTFLGHPVLAMVQEMTSDPRAVARRLADVRR